MMIRTPLLFLLVSLTAAPAFAGNLVINETDDKIIVEYTGDGTTPPADTAKNAPAKSPTPEAAVTPAPPAQKDPDPAAEARAARRRARHQRERTEADE